MPDFLIVDEKESTVSDEAWRKFVTSPAFRRLKFLEEIMSVTITTSPWEVRGDWQLPENLSPDDLLWTKRDDDA